MKQDEVYINIVYYACTFILYVLSAFLVACKLDFLLDKTSQLIISLFTLTLGVKVGAWFVYFFTNS